MKTIELTEDNIKYFHFTDSKYLKDIFENGLIPRIGNNAIGAEDTAKVFFSKGVDGVAKCIDVWIRWRMVEFHKKNTLQKFIDEAVNTFKNKDPLDEKGELSPRDKAELEARHKRAQDKFTEFVASGKADTPEARAYAYEDMYINWVNRTYLSLNLTEGTDKETAHFISTLVGEDKERQFTTGRDVDKKYLEWMYGEFEYQTTQMDSWNMHTFPSTKEYAGRDVEAENVSGIVAVDGKTDGLSVAKKIYDLASNKEKLSDFTKWLKYCKTREKENVQTQEPIKIGKYKFYVYGSEQDRNLVEAFLNRNIKAVNDSIYFGANINVPVRCVEMGKKYFYSTQEEIVSETTMPILAHYITKKPIENFAEEIEFVNNCLSSGAQLSTLGNRYVLRDELLDKIENKELKQHISKINDSARKTEHSLLPQDKKEKNKYILDDIENNIITKQNETEQVLEYVNHK